MILYVKLAGSKTSDQRTGKP